MEWIFKSRIKTKFYIASILMELTRELLSNYKEDLK
jgi:hypothetical protein